ncbi:phosphoenolpyruvate mutase [Buttiauxella sp. A2-C2_NF]|uniref:phosphoenolpyruvate mutase n=1 Tax=Buttiauxella ferragutiae TaxID=82989 RepID=UPI001E2D6C9E|nr:phosphoenolpyruvate mutase [Buttiauxella ferragutiae]MCE0828841.1 phosphoenolpyruvate mutase [Buttiauxella ferragutiae]
MTEKLHFTQKNSSLDLNNAQPSNAYKLKELIFSKELSFIMEAHNGLSAKIVEEEGFKAVWASGLSISTSLGLRDRNEVSWTQVVDVLEYMADSINIPILVDGDTGHGDFNNVRRFVKKLGQRKIGGVCIEDKQFPKTNSFLGENQLLASIPDFVGKIKAAVDTRDDENFCIVARTESLISGFGMAETLKRAEAYHSAGADAILVHSKKSTAEEISKFMNEWDNRCPVVIVPTKYFNTPVSLFEDMGVSTVIWANHNLRSAITSMRETTRQIYLEKSINSAEKNIASLDEVFSLVNMDEIESAERKYSA